VKRHLPRVPVVRCRKPPASASYIVVTCKPLCSLSSAFGQVMRPGADFVLLRLGAVALHAVGQTVPLDWSQRQKTAQPRPFAGAGTVPGSSNSSVPASAVMSRSDRVTAPLPPDVHSPSFVLGCGGGDIQAIPAATA
jgi:hypothetical protein